MKGKIKYIDDTPCILKCSLNSDSICTGCFRSMEEISSWKKADAVAKAMILRKAELRKSTASK